jgi:hypothetical protein
MNNRLSSFYITARQRSILLLAFVCLFLSGCASREPALTKNASVFKKDALETIRLLSPEFTVLLAQNNVQAVKPALEKRVAEAARAGTPFKFSVMLLDRMGIKVAGGMSDSNDGMNFSSYDAARTILQEGKMSSDVFYLGNTRTCTVGAPLVNQGTVVGGIVLGVFEQELKDRWHITEKEFREIDFN